jgi:hypothetical protein
VHDPERAAVLVVQLVGVRQTATCLGTHVDRLGQWKPQAAPVQAVLNFLEVRPFDELHDEEVGVLTRADVEDRDDVRVVEAGGQPRLIEEHVDEVLVLREVREHALDRDALLEALDASRFAQVDLGHAAGFEALDDAIPVISHGARARVG